MTLVDTALEVCVWQCDACGRTVAHYPPLVCACGVEGAYSDVSPVTAVTGASSSEGTPGHAVLATALPELAATEQLASGSPELDRALGGGWTRGGVALVYGRAGSGKSRLCYRWATAAGRTLLVVLPDEMDLELARRTAESAGAAMDRLWLFAHADWRTEAERLDVDCVVLDSVSVAESPLPMLRELGQWAPQRGGVGFAICHTTKRGTHRGPETLRHLARGYSIDVRQVRRAGVARVTIEKSRYSPAPVSLRLSLR